MSRLSITDVGVNMTLRNRRTGELGTVTSTDGKQSLRVRLASGRRITVRADDSGEIRWERDRRKPSQ